MHICLVQHMPQIEIQIYNYQAKASWFIRTCRIIFGRQNYDYLWKLIINGMAVLLDWGTKLGIKVPCFPLGPILVLISDVHGELCILRKILFATGRISVELWIAANSREILSLNLEGFVNSIQRESLLTTTVKKTNFKAELYS